MKSVINFLVFTFFVTASPAWAIPMDSCDYYDYLESQLDCGENGYILKFAKPYCHAYLSRNEEFSLQGQAILRNIRFCLQEVLAAKAGQLNCAEIESYGIASHEDCYVNGGYCDLSAADRMKVFWIARGELFNTHVWSMITTVHQRCIHQ